MRSMHSALVVCEHDAADVADAVANGLAGGGVRAELASFDSAAPVDTLDHDLVVVGAAAAACGRSVSSPRSWAASLPAPDSGRLAAAFDLRLSRPARRWPAASARQLSLALSGRGYRIAAMPIAFRLEAADESLADGELERAVSWGATLAEVARVRSRSPLLVAAARTSRAASSERGRR